MNAFFCLNGVAFIPLIVFIRFFIRLFPVAAAFVNTIPCQTIGRLIPFIFW